MVVALSIVLTVVVLLAGAGVARVITNRAERIRAADADRPERVHRLQRLLVTVFAGCFAGFAALGGLVGALAAFVRHRHENPVWAAPPGVAGFVAVLLALVVGGRTIRHTMAAVRGTPAKHPARRRQVVAGLVIGLTWGVAIAVANLLLPRHGLGHAVGLVLVYVVGLFVLSSVVAPLLIVHISSRPLDAGTARRLTRLATAAGVRVRAFRVLDSRGQKVANAAQLGTLPGLRYVLLTDYLLDHLPPREVDAVVAHELGHARRHHIAAKLAAVAAVWVVLEVAVFAIKAAVGHGPGALLVAPIFVAIPLGIVLTQGLVGIRLERAADDEAVELVGAGELADALEHIGQLNDTKRNTGRGWAILTQHPGLEARLRRLRRPRQGGALPG